MPFSRADFDDFPRGPPPRRGPPSHYEPSNYDEVDIYERHVQERPRSPPRRPPPSHYDEVDIYERHVERSRSPPRRAAAPVKEYDDIDIRYHDGGRERSRISYDRVPAFMREEPKPEAGPLVVRTKETFERGRPPSPDRMSSPPQIRERWEHHRSVSPPRRWERSPSPVPSAAPSAATSHNQRVDIDTRIVRRRPRSPTPDGERDQHFHIMMEREREKAPSPAPSPPPPPPEPPVIRGPTIEREVITHYRDIDHGVERVKPPSPPPPKPKRWDMDIDIRGSGRDMDIDIRQTRARSEVSKRSKSEKGSERPEKGSAKSEKGSAAKSEKGSVKGSEKPKPKKAPSSHYDDEIMIHTGHNSFSFHEGRRRAKSEAPKPEPPKNDWDDEAEYITGRINSRGRHGEAWNGATRDWTILDVPPGTRAVKMDGAGGGGAEISWQRYNGARRAKFIAEQEEKKDEDDEDDDDGPAPSSSGSTAVSRSTRPDKERMSIEIYNRNKAPKSEKPKTEEVHDRSITIRKGSGSRPPPPKKPNEMWTEITKDLVMKEAIKKMGYEYEETEFYFYVMEYLQYEDVLQLVNITDDIRRARKQRAKEIEWEEHYRSKWDPHRQSLGREWDKEDVRKVEREIYFR